MNKTKDLICPYCKTKTIKEITHSFLPSNKMVFCIECYERFDIKDLLTVDILIKSFANYSAETFKEHLKAIPIFKPDIKKARSNI